APEAWIVNFTNPAGMITQALLAEAGPRVVGICDTPRELFLRISWALSAPEEELECDYFGLNHLGWIRSIRLSGEDVTNKILAAESAAAMEEPDWNPFDAAAGYHRIAIETMRALLAKEPERLVLNVPNHRAITDLASEDVVELPSLVDRNGARPLPIGQLPEKV